MSGKPARTAWGDPTFLPGPRPTGTPTINSGSADVLFNNRPAARLGDTAGCGQAISGAFSSTVLINGKNAAMLGSMLSHGGVVTGGSADVVIG